MAYQAYRNSTAAGAESWCALCPIQLEAQALKQAYNDAQCCLQISACVPNASCKCVNIHADSIQILYHFREAYRFSDLCPITMKFRLEYERKFPVLSNM